MTEGVYIATISSGLTLIGVIITSIASNRKIQRNIEHNIELNQAITNTKVEELTREVREHNNFARRMPVVEEQIRYLCERIKNLEDVE